MYLNRRPPLIESKDNLANVFNNYVLILHLQRFLYAPSFESMRSLQFMLCSNNEEERSRLQARMEALFQYEKILDSCHSMHWRVNAAAEALIEYLKVHGADWHAYACENRMATIQENGGKPEDYSDSGEVLYKTDLRSIRPYSIHSVVKDYIGLNDGPVLEGIGSSLPDDFAVFTQMVRKQTDHNPLKLFRERGIDVSNFSQGKPADIASEIEAEMNRDLINAETADYFEAALWKGYEIRQDFARLDPNQNHPEEYQALLQSLVDLLNLEFGLPLLYYSF